MATVAEKLITVDEFLVLPDDGIPRDTCGSLRMRRSRLTAR